MSAYRTVLDHLETAIRSGDLRAGDLLPAERDLAADLGVSRTAVREAIRALQAQGVISSEVGSRGGTRVTSKAGPALAKLLRLHVAVANYPVSDLTEVRIALERTAVKAACEQPSTVVLRQLRMALDAMTACVDPVVFNELDTEFHILLASTGKNALATELTIAVREALRAPILAAEQRLESWDEFRNSLQRQHERIYEAVRDRDTATAQAIVEAHIRTAYGILMGNDPAASQREQVD